MDHLSNQLLSGDPVLISQIISRFVQILKDKTGDAEDILESKEYKFLKDKCISQDDAVNQVAIEGILQVFEKSNTTLVKTVLTDITLLIPTIKSSSRIAHLLNSLLLINLDNELSTNPFYKSSFNLRLPQHPFIIMLIENPSSWNSIFKEITVSYKTANQSKFPHFDQLYKPIYLYILCSIQNEFSLFKQKLWSFLIQKDAFCMKNDQIYNIISWMQFENYNSLPVVTDFLIELASLNNQKNFIDPNILLLWQISNLQQLIFNNSDPREAIFSILNSLENIDDNAVFAPILLTLSKALISCPGNHLLQLLKLCKVIYDNRPDDVITRNILKAVLLHWISNPNLLTSEAVSYANKFFSHIETNNKSARKKSLLAFSSKNWKLINSDRETYFSLQTYCFLEKWKNNGDIIKWLEKLEKSPIFFKMKMFHFLVGLFLTEFQEVSINSQAFDVILKCVEYNKALASFLLSVVLYKLTKTNDKKLHFKLLTALPKMGVSKVNIQKIVGTIQALNKGRNVLKTFSSTLMFELWKIDNKCYNQLESFLLSPYTPPTNKWEFYITRAHILKELSSLKPELYGKDLVAHLSRILNECNNPDGAMACALAIDGITQLCKSGIIDVVTTWTTLSPIFQNENRIPVIKSLCCLINEISNDAYTDSYPDLVKQVIAKLWDYITIHHEREIWKAAFDALTHFTLEQIISQMPEAYLDEECVNLRKDGLVVPGSCWIHLLRNSPKSNLSVVGDFLIKLISLEVSGYLKFVYQVKGTREPVDYSFLPTSSVVRGISIFIKAKINKWKQSIDQDLYLECLRIFSQEYSKPLPPLDWCFLQELFHEPAAKKFSIVIASHQVILSGSARRFVVNYIEAVGQNYKEDDVLLLYENLKFLANSVQPFTLKPFFESTLQKAIINFNNDDEKMLLEIFKELKPMLENPDIQESNKVVIYEILENVIGELDIGSQLFQVLLQIIILFPMKCIDNLSNPKLTQNPTPAWFKKATIIRCSLALNSKSATLNVLNDLLDSTFPETKNFLFEQFSAVFLKHLDNTECVLWLLDLLGKIQALSAEKAEEKQIRFNCEIFILAIIVFSGHFVFLTDFSEIYKLFPRALATLLDVNHWSICSQQTLDWLHYMTNDKMFAAEKTVFIQCLKALRHETEFHKNMKWTKYLNVEF